VTDRRETDQIAKSAVTGSRINDAAIAGKKVKLDTLPGDNIDETTLGQVPDSDRVDGIHASGFVRSNVYKSESAVQAGTSLGDGTFYIDHACDAGDRLLSGGPANVRFSSDMVESFPSPGSTNSWRARNDKNGFADNFSVVILCADQQ
jgi:hypothetical protein